MSPLVPLAALPRSLTRRQLVPLAAAGLVLTALLYLFVSGSAEGGGVRTYEFDSIDLRVHLPAVPSFFGGDSASFSSSNNDDLDLDSDSSEQEYSSGNRATSWFWPPTHPSWSRPRLPAYCTPESDYWSKKYTQTALEMSRAYSGSGARFRRVVEKAMRGEGVRWGVIGGSVSTGRNVLPTQTYHHLLHTYWNTSLFPHSQNTLVDGSKPATDSKYFSMCFGEHLGANGGEEVDVVLVELSINDQRTLQLAGTWETLVRALLELPNRPAVIAVSTFALQFAQGIGVGGDVHLGVAQYYDIPVISLRNPLLPHLFAHPSLEREIFGFRDLVDRRHINALGHEMMADFVAWWVREQVCRVWGEKDLPPASKKNIEPNWWTEPVDYSAVPRLRMTDAWIHVNDTHPTLRPSCASTSSTPPLAPSSTTGWSWEEAPGDKFYWSSSTPGARITFDINVVEGRVGMFFLRSRTKGLGEARCWVDSGEEGGAVAVGWWDREESVAQFIGIAGTVPPGPHTLTCEISKSTKDPGGGTGFKIIGLATV